MSEVTAYSIFCEASDLSSCPVVRPSHLAQALHDLLDRKVRLINLSLGINGPVTGSLAPLHRAYHRAEREGVVVVAAAGNDGHGDANPLFRDRWVIPVAAEDAEGGVLPTSNRGGAVARGGLLAPGYRIDGLAPGGGHTQMSGTSAAAPWVTAGAALLWSLVPEASAAEIRDALLLPDVPRDGDIPPTLNLARSQRWLARQHPRVTSTVRRSPMHDHLDPIPRPEPTAPPLAAASTVMPAQGSIIPQDCGCAPGPGLGFVFSTGQLSPRFANEGDQREFETQARELRVPTDDFFAVLTKRRYLARRICWVLEVAQRPTVILAPRSEAELTDLIAALSPELSPNPELAVTGTLGVDAGPERCNGLTLPQVSVTELSYFTQDALLQRLIADVHLDPGATTADLERAARRLWTLLGVWREPGLDDTQRAKNYVALRTTSIYAKTVALAQMTAGQFWLSEVSTQAQSTEAGRSLMDVDFQYANASGQTQTFRAQIDVTNLFAFQSKALFAV